MTVRKRSTKAPVWKSWIFLGTLVFWTIAVAGVTLMALREFRAASQVDAIIRSKLSQCIPVDIASKQKWFRDNTHTEGTAAWREIISLASDIEFYSYISRMEVGGLYDLPIVGNGRLPDMIEPDKPWPVDAEVNEFLNTAQPFFDKIEEAAKYPAPVWQPIRFQGISTLIPEIDQARDIYRIVQLETEHALYHRDSDRAMRGIKMLRATADAFNWNISLSVKLVHNTIVNSLGDSIRRSMACEIWNEEQTLQLLEIIGPQLDVQQDWTEICRGEFAMSYASINDPDQFIELTDVAASRLANILLLPSARLSYLESCQNMADVGQGGIAGLEKRAYEFGTLIQERKQLDFLSSLLLPAFQGIADAYLRNEDARRLAVTCLAVKLFQLKNHRWPDDLNELKQIGFTSTDWTTLNHGPFGYDFDDKRAHVWSYRHYGEGEWRAVPDSRPVAEPSAAPEYTPTRTHSLTLSR